MSQYLAPIFGNGSDGVLTISSNTTDAPTDSSCSGSSGSTSLSATNASFEAGQMILIHQSRGTGAGQWEVNKIASYTAGTITTTNPLAYDYTDSGASQAQVLVLKQYSQVTVDSGKTWTAKAWGGDVGGILAFLCSGKVTVTGTISATGKGFAGGNGKKQGSGTFYAYCGENLNGASAQAGATGNGGGGGYINDAAVGDCGAGGGGANGADGTGGSKSGGFATGGSGGTASGTVDLTTIVFGGGGGGGAADADSIANGGAGGGIVLIFYKELSLAGSITLNGVAGGNGGNPGASGGGGAGGSCLIKGQEATLGTNLITATGGSGGTGETTGGNGGNGRVRVEYQASSGTTNPSASASYYYFGVDHSSMI